MLIFITIYLLTLSLSFGSECDISDNIDDISSTINNLDTSIKEPLKILDCNNFKALNNKSLIDNTLRSIVQSQTNEVLNIKGRHEIGQKLNVCKPSKTSKALVISFAGTGAYNPRSHSLMSTLIRCQEFQKLAPKYKKYVYSSLLVILKDKESKFTNWSGIDKGLMSEFLTNPKVNGLATQFNFATYASEESEFIADPSKLSRSSLIPLIKEVKSSLNNSPAGITNAKDCVTKYFNEAKVLSISPKLIIVSHSSGGRTAVKFLEEIKNVKESDLTLTIDPVIEAQHAIQEVASQKLGNLGRSIFGKEKKPVNVWSRKQPKKLYKVNSAKWFNFYQQSDSKGFNMNPPFGIQGSPVKDADNTLISDLGDQAHGEITYNDEVLDIMTTQIYNLFK